MRKIENTGQFRRDYKREAKGLYRVTLDAELVPVLAALARDESLEPRHRDHALTGEWKDHRDCHLTSSPP
jgi:mRNA interferase YafQ